MSTVAEMLAKIPTPEFPPDELLISEDGVPLETDWHRVEIGLLVELVNQNFAGRNDYFAGGNMFIYFDEQRIRNRNFRGPDFFFVWGASPMPLRPYWAVWKEGGHYPNVIIELLSPATAEEDRTTKKNVYEEIFSTDEYFLYDPDSKKLEGFRLDHGKYQSIVGNENGWLWSRQLKLWIGIWDGWYQNRHATWLRFYTPEGVLVPTIAELATDQLAFAEKNAKTATLVAATAQQQAAAAQQKADAAQQKVDAARQQAASAEQNAAVAKLEADEQRRRAEAAEAELARIKSQLEQQAKP